MRRMLSPNYLVPHHFNLLVRCKNKLTFHRKCLVILEMPKICSLYASKVTTRPCIVPQCFFCAFKISKRGVASINTATTSLLVMGSIQSIDVQPMVVPTGRRDDDSESVIYRNIRIDQENGGNFIATFRNQPESLTPIDILRCSATKYADLDCTGERVINADGTPGPYRFISFKEFYRRVLAMGRGMLELGIKRGDRIGIFGNNSQYYQMVAFGAYSIGAVIVPVYDSLGKDAASHIVNHAEVKVLFVSHMKYPNAIALIPEIKDKVAKIVVLGDAVPPIPETEFSVTTCKDVLESGFESKEQNVFSLPDDTAVIMYTSGSTGTPKGCVLTCRNVVAGAAGLGCVNMSLTPADTHLSFLPLAHVYAMAAELIMYAQGVRVGFSRGIIKEIMDDIQALKPTVLVAVPRILNRVAEVMRYKISTKPAFIRKALDAAIAAKAKAIKENRGYSQLLDGILFKNFRAALGGRIRMMVSGGAPITQDVFEFLCATVCPNIIQGYGLTEVSSGLAVQEAPATNPRTVGASTIGCEIKLRPVEGTTYDPNGEVPAGELLVRGPCVFQGYYKQQDLTDEVLHDGWFATGDVVRITKEGQLEIIDRAKQLVKLSQGEYLSLSSLNEAYARADVATFVYVYANPMYDEPLAVVIPKPEKIKEWEDRGVKDITKDKTVHDECIQSLRKVFEHDKMRGFERINHVIIDTFEPTVENGFLTPSMKPQYAALRKKYEPALLDLYNAIIAAKAPKT